MLRLTQLGFASLVLVAAGCAGEDHESNRSTGSAPAAAESARASSDSDELDGLSLTQAQCSIASNIQRVTASPRAQLFINAPLVLNDARANNATVGKWSFAYAMREILELPAPGADPVKLAAEQARIVDFIGKFTQTTKVNGFTPSNRAGTAASLNAAWGTTRGTDAKLYKTFDKAPFKLVAIVNRLDIVKKDKTAVTAGEGRFIYGFTGPGQMTVILEYDLPIGAASNKNLSNAVAWAQRWQALKGFLADTNATVAGVQPNASTTVQPTFANPAGYLAALEGVTELWANRTAQIRVGGTQAAISQIRTNEILDNPWELREIVRGARTAAGATTLTLTTVKNNPNLTLNNNPVLKNWLLANVRCTGTTINSCAYNTANAQIPAQIPNGATPMNVLAAESFEDFTRWFNNPADVKLKFFAQQTCNGCHTTETNTSFTHVSTSNGAPSAFLLQDLVGRMQNFKNLVCLGAATVNALNLGDVDAATASPDDLNALRVELSPWTH